MALHDETAVVDDDVLARVTACSPDAVALLDAVVRDGRSVHRLRWSNDAGVRLLEVGDGAPLSLAGLASSGSPSPRRRRRASPAR